MRCILPLLCLWIGACVGIGVVVAFDTETLLKQFYDSTHGDQWSVSCNPITSICWGDTSTNVTYCDWPGVQCLQDGRILLELAQNNINGPFPSFLGHIVGLTVVRFSHNGLSGTIEQEFFINGNLTIVDVSYNSLTGSLPSTYMNPLRVLNAGFNQLGGEIPSGVFIPSLKSLDLQHNALKGEIPPTVSQSPLLEYLILNTNNLHGSIPSSIGSLSALQNLILGENQFQSPLPSELQHLHSLSSFDVHNNLFDETLPDWIQMWNVSYLNFGYNSFRGVVPAGVFACDKTGLLVINVAHNEMSGTLPVPCADPATLNDFQLHKIDFSNNHFSGDIPVAYYGLPKLSFLQLSENELTGCLADDLREAVEGGFLGLFDVQGNTDFVSCEDELPQYLTSSPHMVYQARVLSYWCHAIEVTGAVSAEIFLSPSYFHYDFCECTDGYFGEPPTDCTRCPSHCSCAGTEVSWSRGYSPVIGSKKNFLGVEACFDHMMGTNSLCCKDSDCTFDIQNGLSSHPSQCPSYAKDRLCSKCTCTSASCHHFDGRQCASCTSQYFVIIYIVVILVGGIGFYLLSQKVRSRVQSRFAEALSRKDMLSRMWRDTGSMFEIVIFYFQILSQINQNAWHSKGVNGFYGSLKWSFIVSARHTALECIFRFLADPVSLLLFTLCSPLLIVTGTVGCATLYRWFKHERTNAPNIHSNEEKTELLVTNGRPDMFVEGDAAIASDETDEMESFMKEQEEHVTLKQYALRIFVLLTRVLYFPIVNAILEVFHCHEQDLSGTRFMETYPWIECSDHSKWSTLRLISFVFLVPYVIAIPILLALALFLHRREIASTSSSNRVSYWLGGFYDQFSPKFFFFGLALLVFRLALAVLYSVCDSSSFLHQWGIGLILFIMFTSQALMKPYASRHVNAIAGLTTFILVEAWQAIQVCKYGESGGCSEEFEWIQLAIAYVPPFLVGLAFVKLMLEVGRALRTGMRHQ